MHPDMGGTLGEVIAFEQALKEGVLQALSEGMLLLPSLMGQLRPDKLFRQQGMERIQHSCFNRINQ